jgi:hypothetical protein
VSKVVEFFKNQKVRGYLYRVAFAVGVLLVGEGLITEGEFVLYEGVATALLGLASVNTSVRD